MQLKGFRTELFNLTKRTRSTVKPRTPVKTVADDSKRENYYVNPTSSKIRQVEEWKPLKSKGAARTQAIIEGTVLVNAVIDPGSHCTIISKKMADILNMGAF